MRIHHCTGIITLLITHTLLFVTQVQAQGLTFDLCNSTSSCVGTRKCYDTSTSDFKTCSTSTVSVCVCYPDEPIYCQNSDACPEGETCARTEDTASACYSNDAVEGNDRLFQFNEPPSPLPLPSIGSTPPPLWESVGSIPRSESCTQPLQCASGLFCLSFSSSSCQGSNDNCRCVPRGSGGACNTTSDCSNDDECVNINGSRLPDACLPSDIAAVVSPEPMPPTKTPSFSKVPTASFIFPTSLPTISPLDATAIPSITIPSVTDFPRETVFPDVTIGSPAFVSASIAPSNSAPSTMPSVDPQASETAIPSAVSVPEPVPSSEEMPTPTSYDDDEEATESSMTGEEDADSTDEDGERVDPTNEESSGDEEPETSHENGDRVDPSATAEDGETVPETSEEGTTVEPDASDSTSFPSSEPVITTEGGSDTVNDATTSPETEDGICVSVDHLTHVAKEHLVYDQHKHAKVLCDEHLSCSTPGHMVVFKGHPMMMSRYCEHTKCTSTVKLVNNVKYSSVHRRIQSRSKDLQFSALAARYSTRAEESILKVLVYMGF